MRTGMKDTEGRLVGFVMLGCLALVLGACGGGGRSKDAAVPDLQVTITNSQTITNPATGEQIICFDFDATGAPNQEFDLEFTYFEDDDQNQAPDTPGATFLMTEISQATADAFNMAFNTNTFETGVATGFVIGGTGMSSGRFCWQAGTDLGFIGTDPTGPEFLSANAAPVAGSGQPGQQLMGSGVVGLTYEGGNPPTTPTDTSGVGGIARHTAHETRTTAAGSDDNVIAAAGISSANPDVQRDNIDRFSYDGPSNTINRPVMGFGQNTREDHASASFISGNGFGVLVTGGQSAGVATSTADLYNASPIDTVTPAAGMSEARFGHTATWLPNNMILIVGGQGSNPTSVEAFDPATETFMSLAPIDPDSTGTTVGRTNHTATLLPDGRVLIAGGFDPIVPVVLGANAAPVNGLIFQPDYLNFTAGSGSWIDTACPIDREDHTATLLVNGAVILAGGRTVSTGVVVSEVDAFRTFGNNLFGGGFSTKNITPDDLNIARAEHDTARLGTGDLLVVGGFDAQNPGASLSSTEVFFPNCFTAPDLGFFSPLNPNNIMNGVGGAVGNGGDLANARAQHTATTVRNGSVVVIGGVEGTETNPTVLNSIEVYQFDNTPPTATGLALGPGVAQPHDTPFTFTFNDAEGDKGFCFVRFSTDGGATFNFATLTDYAKTVNLQDGQPATLNWNRQADGVGAGDTVILQVIPVGGAFGQGTTVTATF